MTLECKLVRKTFIDKDTNEPREYFVLVFELADGTSLDVTLKGDKAKLLQMSYSLSKNK